MKRKTFTEWVAEIDRSYWFDTYYFGDRYVEPGVAWELESEKSLQDQDEEL